MQQQDILGPGRDKQALNASLDDVRGLVVHYLNIEAADRGIAQYPAQRFGVRGGGAQVLQRPVLVGVVGDYQCFPLAGHWPPFPAECRLANNSISRS